MPRRLFVGGAAHGRVLDVEGEPPTVTLPTEGGAETSETYVLRVISMEGMDRTDRRWTRIYLKRGSDPSIGVVLDAAAVALGLERNRS